MEKIIILLIAALLPVGVTAADTNQMDSEEIAKLIARNTMRGYHGFVELGMGVNLHGFEVEDKFQNVFDYSNGFGAEVLTTHGFQFNNYFFLGGGVGISECTETNLMVPIFADMRINILNRRISPVIDIKGGYAVGNHDGGYVALNAGVRFGLKNNLNSAIYLMAEISYIGDSNQRGFLKEHMNDKNLECERLALKIGYEF